MFQFDIALYITVFFMALVLGKGSVCALTGTLSPWEDYEGTGKEGGEGGGTHNEMNASNSLPAFGLKKATCVDPIVENCPECN